MKIKIMKLVLPVLLALAFTAPSYAIFDIAGTFGPVGNHSTTIGSADAIEDIDISNYGGFADFTFSLPIPAINFVMGLGFYGDYASLSKDSVKFDASLIDGGAQLLIGGGLFDATLMLRMGGGVGAGTNNAEVSGVAYDQGYFGTHYFFAPGLDYKVFMMLHLYTEVVFNNYSLTAPEVKVTVSGKELTIPETDFELSNWNWRFGVRIAL